MSYEFSGRGGVITYNYQEDKQPDTKVLRDFLEKETFWDIFGKASTSSLSAQHGFIYRLSKFISSIASLVQEAEGEFSPRSSYRLHRM